MEDYREIDRFCQDETEAEEYKYHLWELWENVSIIKAPKSGKGIYIFAVENKYPVW